MNELEISARTVEEATQQALDHLGVDINQVEIEVLKKGKHGILGFAGEEARIRVKLLSESPKSDMAKAAKEVLEQLLRLVKVDARVQITSTEVPVQLNIEGDDLGILIGRRGQTLSSLQYVVRLVLAEKLKAWLPINIDVAGYKKHRQDALEKLALRLADKVRTTRRPTTLEPMPPDERRIIHLVLADNAFVTTQSTGDGEERKVVISPKR
jgi:spoIIIJ-associated protein